MWKQFYQCVKGQYPQDLVAYLERCHHMMTSSNGNIFRVTGPLCGEFTGPRWIPHTKASDVELWCFLWSTPNKWLSKQMQGWWFETHSPPLWRHSNELIGSTLAYVTFEELNSIHKFRFILRTFSHGKCLTYNILSRVENAISKGWNSENILPTTCGYFLLAPVRKGHSTSFWIPLVFRSSTLLLYFGIRLIGY